MGTPRRIVVTLARAIKFKDLLFKMTSLPVMSSLTRLMLDKAGTSITLLPVLEEVDLDGGTTMPLKVVEHFIEEASHHVILDFCPCRNSIGCKDYPVDRGCIFLGEGARDINPGVGRHVSKEEALAHIRGGAELGLLPVIGKVDFDAVLLGVKDRNRLMTVCQCCPCCCLTTGLHYAPDSVRDGVVKRLEGLEVRVAGDCKGCGKCVESCIFRQISLAGDRAVVGEACKGCGRCVAACPHGAIGITMNDADYLQACIDRIGATVDVT